MRGGILGCNYMYQWRQMYQKEPINYHKKLKSLRNFGQGYILWMYSHVDTSGSLDFLKLRLDQHLGTST